jgi:hypothetical protein
MKSIRYQSHICAVALLFSSTLSAQTQVPNTFRQGEPARADEVNANFSALESAVNQNAGDIAANADDIAANAEGIAGNAADIAGNAADIAAVGEGIQAAVAANSEAIADLESTVDDQELKLSILEHDMDLVLDRVIPCGEYRLYGCTQSTSADGTVFERRVFWGGIYNVASYIDPTAAVVGDSLFFAIPIADGDDFQNLWIGGSSNLTRTLSSKWGAVLVDNCVNPTVELVRTGEPASTRLVVNDGSFYRAKRDAGGQYGPIVDTVDVTGQTYGLINPQTPGNIVEACTMVSDKTGLYDVYEIEFKFNVFDGRFDSVWTHQ